MLSLVGLARACVRFFFYLFRGPACFVRNFSISFHSSFFAGTLGIENLWGKVRMNIPKKERTSDIQSCLLEAPRVPFQDQQRSLHLYGTWVFFFLSYIPGWFAVGGPNTDTTPTHFWTSYGRQKLNYNKKKTRGGNPTKQTKHWVNEYKRKVHARWVHSFYGCT